MPSSARALRLEAALLFVSISALPIVCSAQATPDQPAPVFTSIAPIAFDHAGPVIRAHTEPLKPFTVAGQRGVLVGQQDGVFESWILPVKLLSHLTIEADVEGYGVPIDVNQQSAAIEVRPDRTIITYSHPAFTVRQIMFSPGGRSNGAQPPIVLFEFDCLHPTDFTFRFTPELRWMWPERNEGAPGPEWVSPDPRNPTAPGGFYVLHTDYPDLAGALTIPGATPGILAPYQERPQIHPVELKLHIDPSRDQKKLFPLFMADGMSTTTATNAALAATLAQLNASIPALYQTHAEDYKKLLANSVSIETPDKSLNEAFQWAVVSIEQLKTKIIPGQSSPPPPALGASGPSLSGTGASAETALVAGYFTSADSARPGFGWFFGRDALYTLYAVNGYGDFALSKSELEFLIHRQRADGKIMHEYSQTAAAIDWQSFPYMYAAADSTPLFLLAVADYVRASGDTAFLTDLSRRHRKSLGLRNRSRPRHRPRRHLRQLAGHRLGRKLARRHAPPGNLPRAPRPASLFRRRLHRRPTERLRQDPPPPSNEPAPSPRPSTPSTTTRKNPATPSPPIQPARPTVPSTAPPPSIPPWPGGILPTKNQSSTIPKLACGNSPHRPSTPTGAPATSPTPKKSTTASATTRAPSGRSSPAGPRSPNTAPTNPSPAINS